MIFLYEEAHEATNATQRMMTFQFTMKSKLPQQVVTWMTFQVSMTPHYEMCSCSDLLLCVSLQ